MDFQFSFLMYYQKPQLYSAKVFIQEDFKFDGLVLYSVKHALFFALNAIILLSISSNFLRMFPQITLIV
jgi:hypothetical protein